MSLCPSCRQENPAGSTSCEFCGASLSAPSQPVSVPAELERQVRSQLAAGNKIQAIKVFRERTGTGLKEAKDAVEAIERGQPPVFTGPRRVDESFRRELVGLLEQGGKIEAIKLYRERTGAGLKDAKDAVERLGVGVAPAGSRGVGCLGFLLLGVLASVLGPTIRLVAGLLGFPA